MDFDLPAELTDYLAVLDEFIEREIKPLEAADDNIRFFDHRREDSRTDWDRGGLPNEEWEALLGEARHVNGPLRVALALHHVTLRFADIVCDLRMFALAAAGLLGTTNEVNHSSDGVVDLHLGHGALLAHQLMYPSHVRFWLLFFFCFWLLPSGAATKVLLDVVAFLRFWLFGFVVCSCFCFSQAFALVLVATIT